MSRLLKLLTATTVSASAGCASFVHKLFNGPADLEERRQAAQARERDDAAKTRHPFFVEPTTRDQYEQQELDVMARSKR